jgi:hypothetical protein
MNSTPVGDSHDFHDLTWKEHGKLLLQAVSSARLFGMIFATTFLLMFTVGVVFQIIFLFCFLPAFMILARLSQPVYSAFVFIVNDKRLPHALPKPPASAYLSSIIPLLISVFFLYIGIITFQNTGFCGQSLGCAIIFLFQRLIGK